MKGTFVKIVAVAVIVMGLAAPVSARVAGPQSDRVTDETPALSLGIPVLADWYEDWDSYPTGQNMHGIGGWKGWGNDGYWTAYTTDVEFISDPNSIDINGNSDLVHEYAIDDGVWTYTAWQYVPDGFADESYFILLNQYDDPGVTTNWSTQVRFDGNDGLAVFQGYYNDLAQLPLIVGQWVELRVEIDLTADWQQFYYGGDLLYEASWSAGIGAPTPGITSIGAVDLFANGATPVYYDDLSLVEAGGNPMYAAVKLRTKMQGGAYVVVATAFVRDGQGMPIEFADVTMWMKKPNGNTNTQTRMTSPTGRAYFPMASPTGGPWRACIENVQHPDYVWDDSGRKCATLWWGVDPPPPQ